MLYDSIVMSQWSVEQLGKIYTMQIEWSMTSAVKYLIQMKLSGISFKTLTATLRDAGEH